MLKSFTRIGLPKFLLGAVSIFFIPTFALAQTGASLSISPDSGTFAAGKTFTVNIVIDSADGFNTGNATLNYDPAVLSATGVSKGSSAFSLWAVEPSFDNSKGTVSFEGGNTSPLTGKKTILSVSFKGLTEGKTDLSFSAGSVLAADGKGTDILGAKNGASFTIGAKELAVEPPPAPPAAPTDTGGGGGVKPDAPIVSSPTHSDESLYYNAKKAKFTWDLPPDVTVVRLALDTSGSTTPTTNYDPAISEKEFDQLTDGVMYFHLRYKNDGGWGPVTHRKIMVDRTPPPAFEVEATTDASSSDVILKFSATDTLSGIDHYELTVDGGTPVKASLAELLSGEYNLTGQELGDHKLKVAAFDKAGNAGEGAANFKITYDAEAAKKGLDEGEAKPTDWRLIIDIVLVAFIAFLLGYLWYERGAFLHEKYVSKREADEVRDNLGNIFAALREEVGEQVTYLFDKPNPSALNREVLGNINEAIDLSEELLSKEVEDVRKLLS
jgi:hypothetical protein